PDTILNEPVSNPIFTVSGTESGYASYGLYVMDANGAEEYVEISFHLVDHTVQLEPGAETYISLVDIVPVTAGQISFALNSEFNPYDISGIDHYEIINNALFVRAYVDNYEMKSSLFPITYTYMD